MKILIVDDHALLRDALCGVLSELQADATILEASDSREARRAVDGHGDLDLILLDLALPDRSGFDLLAELRSHDPSMAIVVLSATQDRDVIVKALDLGAVGFIPKSASRKVIAGALQLVFSGGVYIPPQALPCGTGSPAQQAPLKELARNGIENGRPSDLGLTSRQLDVLALLRKGKSNKLISRALDIAEPTVKHHIRAILKALKASNRTEAVVAASQLDWGPATKA